MSKQQDLELSEAESIDSDGDPELLPKTPPPRKNEGKKKRLPELDLSKPPASANAPFTVPQKRAAPLPAVPAQQAGEMDTAIESELAEFLRLQEKMRIYRKRLNELKNKASRAGPDHITRIAQKKEKTANAEPKSSTKTHS